MTLIDIKNSMVAEKKDGCSEYKMFQKNKNEIELDIIKNELKTLRIQNTELQLNLQKEKETSKEVEKKLKETMYKKDIAILTFKMDMQKYMGKYKVEDDEEEGKYTLEWKALVHQHKEQKQEMQEKQEKLLITIFKNQTEEKMDQFFNEKNRLCVLSPLSKKYATRTHDQDACRLSAIISPK